MQRLTEYGKGGRIGATAAEKQQQRGSDNGELRCGNQREIELEGAAVQQQARRVLTQNELLEEKGQLKGGVGRRR